MEGCKAHRAVDWWVMFLFFQGNCVSKGLADAYLPACIVPTANFDGRIIVWGCFSGFGPGPLCMRTSLMFQHTKTLGTVWGTSFSIPSWLCPSAKAKTDWDAQSLDLWDILVQRLQDRPSHPTSVPDLIIEWRFWTFVLRFLTFPCFLVFLVSYILLCFVNFMFYFEGLRWVQRYHLPWLFAPVTVTKPLCLNQAASPVWSPTRKQVLFQFLYWPQGAGSKTEQIIIGSHVKMQQR